MPIAGKEQHTGTKWNNRKHKEEGKEGGEMHPVLKSL